MDMMKYLEYVLSNNHGEYTASYYTSDAIVDNILINCIDGGNNGEIVNCKVVSSSNNDFKELKIPFRRESTFNLLYHEDNGFYENKWKTQFTRWNQLKFYNEVS